MNDIGRISLRTAVPLFHDSYRRNRLTGSFVLVDPGTHETVAAGMVI
jgi:sulfate adenylyltransferase subunit 1 (EFTu-like GTPase family)